MDIILENIKAIGPVLLVSWLIYFIFTALRPQKYSNSVILMITLIITMVFAAGLFGENMGIALMWMFIIIMIALFLVPLMLILNGIYLLKHESVCFGHMLSLILGILVGIGEIAAIVFVLSTAAEMGESFNFIHPISYFIGASAFYFCVLILNFVVYCIFIQFMPHINRYDYLIIHGCGLEDGKELSMLLKHRVDKAIEVYKKCSDKPKIIASGGKGDDEHLSEAQAIKNYLVDNGIPDNDVILEDQSPNTLANVINSKKIIDERGGAKRIGLVSSNFHIYRCLTYAKKQKMKCIGIGAKVAAYYWPTAIIREFVAIFKTPKFIIWAAIGYILFIIPVFYM